MKNNDYRELLLGCGHAREKHWSPRGADRMWKNLTTLDLYSECEPDWLCNLGRVPWVYYPTRPTDDNTQWVKIPDSMFDEVHAYEVLEHFGDQGNATHFFDTFSEIYRILKPGGYLIGSTPALHSPWLWGDPSHKRVILPESLAFLDRQIIAHNRRAKTSMSDFSALWQGDFEITSRIDDITHEFVCLAHKPPRKF